MELIAGGPVGITSKLLGKIRPFSKGLANDLDLLRMVVDDSTASDETIIMICAIIQRGLLDLEPPPGAAEQGSLNDLERHPTEGTDDH